MNVPLRTPACLIAALIGLSPSAFSSGARADEPELRAELRMSKSIYVHHEPLEVIVRVTNPTSAEIVVWFYYPSSKSRITQSGLKFDAKKAGLRAVQPEEAIGGGRQAGHTLKPGASFTTTIYLQRFVEQPSAGKFVLPYEARVPCTRKEDKRELPLLARGHAELRFKVAPRDDEKLMPILEGYLKRAEQSRDSLEAIEALSVIDDPVVVPYLVRLVDRTLGRQGLSALTRFKHVEEARLVVEECLSSKDHLVVGAALNILTEWKHELSVRQVKQLLDRNYDSEAAREWITGLVTAYVDAMGQEKYRKVLPPEDARARESTADVTIAMSRSHFLEHEPIEFQIALTNRGPGPISPHLYYPSFLSLAAERRLKFDLKGTNLTEAPAAGIDRFHLFERRDPLKPGEKLTWRCYLQRHVSQPVPGKYRLPFTLEAAYLVGRPVFDTEKLARTKGELAFTILPRDQRKLEFILQGFLERTKDLDHCGEAVEALVVVSDPVVVPSLLKLYQNSRAAARHLESIDPFDSRRISLGRQSSLIIPALAGLARFPDVEPARKAVLDTLGEKYPDTVGRALAILTQWKHEIRVEQLKELIDRNDNYLTAQIERYVKTIGREDYKKLLPK